MPAVTTGMAIVFAIIVIALVLFATEPVPVDVTAIGITVTLMVLAPWTGVTTALGLSGFASEATITVLPTVAVLGLFYLLTAVLTNVVSNNASVVLMVPVAYEAALALDASALTFVLAVTFAASTAFMTPIGYQTNLFVYGPGGYRFTDYVRVGGPLQLVFAVVTTVGLWAFRGV